VGLLLIIGLVLVLALIFGPQYWVKYVIRKHGRPRKDFPGTGGELAQHFISEFNIPNAKVEITDQGDHYDPRDRTVRLLPSHYDGRSVAAIAIAAHEIGHAIQHAEGDSLLAWRQRLATFAGITDKFASIFFLIAPILALVVCSPGAFFTMILIGVSFIAVRLLVHIVTLPVEFDASFNKALPLLQHGEYLHRDDIPAVKQVLRAAALTYVSVALASLLDLARWIRIIR